MIIRCGVILCLFLSGCVTSRIEQSRDTVTGIQADEAMVILGRASLETKINWRENQKNLENSFGTEIYSSWLKNIALLKEYNQAEVNLVNSENGISPGQACVFYNKDQIGHKVLGGGWIKN